MRRKLTVGIIAAGLFAAYLIPGQAAGASAHRHAAGVRFKELSPNMRLPLRTPARAVTRKAVARPAPKVGAHRQWLALDDQQGQLYLKSFKLRGVGKHVEVWTAQGHDLTSQG